MLPDMDIQRIRQDFPALKQYIWFQNGGVSITPQPVADEHARLMRELLERGPMQIVYPDEEYPRRRRSLERLAEFFFVSPTELAVMRGVSEAFQTVIRGVSWRTGDRIIITEDEEAALLLPALHLRERHGVEVVKLPLIPDVKRQTAALDECLNDRTRLVAISLVTTDLGYRLPVKALCTRAGGAGALTFVDLAHSAGLYPISLEELGCDFAGILSYKWMYAPYASGLLYVRQKRVDDLEITYAGGRSEAWLDFENDRYGLRDTAERFQYGPWSWPLIHAWAFAAEYLEGVGRENIWERTTGLTSRFKQGLATIPGSVLYTPESSDYSAALVAFGIGNLSGAFMCDALRRRWNIITKPIPHSKEGLRVSITFVTLEDEVDLLLEALRTLVSEDAGQPVGMP